MRDRILTALAGIPVVLAAVFCTNPWPIGILVLAAAAIALYEAGALAFIKLHWAVALLLATSVLGVLGFRYLANQWEIVVASYCLLAVHVVATIAAAVAFHRKRTWLYFAFACLYVGLPLLGALNLHGLDYPDGRVIGWDFANSLLALLLPVWAGDTAAIFVGKAFGKHKLAASISPKKTWEGSIANLLAAIGVAIALSGPLRIDLGAAAGIGVVCGTLGQAGDLFESWLKRQSGAKDSGDILPGHGGVLDRVDSLLFTAIPVLAIMATARFGFPWR